VPEPVWEPPPISHRETDEAIQLSGMHWLAAHRSARFQSRPRHSRFGLFWRRCRGLKGNRAKITFDHDPVTIEELFDQLEKLCGAAGWQLAQKLGVI
jgi:hypothetical protein